MNSGAGSVAQVIECLPSRKKERRERGRKEVI
jgi:hypothetical protein